MKAWAAGRRRHGQHHRHPPLPALEHGHLHGQLGQQGHPGLVGQQLAAAAAEEGVAAVGQIGGDEGGHVLHHPQHRHSHLQEHRQAAAGILQGHLLGGGDDHHAGHRHGLGEGELGIAGAGGQIHHQHVALAPVHLIEELADDAVEHGAPPDHRLVLLDQQPHRHHHDAAALDRLQHLVAAAAAHLGAAVGHPQHGGGVGAVDVGIQQAHPQAGSGQGTGQVHRHRALAHTPLAAADGDHLTHPGDPLPLRQLARARGRRRRSGPGRCCPRLGQFDLHVVDPVERQQAPRASAAMRSRWLVAKPGRASRNTARRFLQTQLAGSSSSSSRLRPLPAS